MGLAGVGWGRRWKNVNRIITSTQVQDFDFFFSKVNVTFAKIYIVHIRVFTCLKFLSFCEQARRGLFPK